MSSPDQPQGKPPQPVLVDRKQIVDALKQVEGVRTLLRKLLGRMS